MKKIGMMISNKEENVKVVWCPHQLIHLENPLKYSCKIFIVNRKLKLSLRNVSLKETRNLAGAAAQEPFHKGQMKKW